MPGNSDFTTGKETALPGNLRAFLDLLGGAHKPPPPRPPIDPAKAREALAHALTVLTAEDERGLQARAALRQTAYGLKTLLMLIWPS